MTAQELADQTGLSLEEAEMVLAARAAKANGVVQVKNSGSETRLGRALQALLAAEKKVGVKPYEESK